MSDLSEKMGSLQEHGKDYKDVVIPSEEQRFNSKSALSKVGNQPYSLTVTKRNKAMDDACKKDSNCMDIEEINQK